MMVSVTQQTIMRTYLSPINYNFPSSEIGILLQIDFIVSIKPGSKTHRLFNPREKENEDFCSLHRVVVLYEIVNFMQYFRYTVNLSHVFFD